jgi:hypothetical protein
VTGTPNGDDKDQGENLGPVSTVDKKIIEAGAAAAVAASQAEETKDNPK